MTFRKIFCKTQCQFCLKHNCLLSAQKGESTVFRCERCQKIWEHGPDVCSFQSITMPYGTCTNIFNGLWLHEEIQLIQHCAFKHNEKGYDEWGWYKGRNFYTAWRLGKSNLVIKFRELPDLVDKVAELCKPLHSL